MRAVCGVLVVNHVVLAAWHHPFAAVCVDAATLLFVLNAAVVEGRRSGEGDDAAARAYAALALAAAAPVAAAALPLRHMSETVATITLALPMAGAAVYLAPRQQIPLTPLVARGRPLIQLAMLPAALGLGFCASVLKAPTVDRHNAAPLIGGVVALLLAAVTEELVFRGVLQRSLARTLGPEGTVLATVVSAALYTGSGWWIVPTIGALASFALVVAATGAIGTAILAHCTFTVSAAVVWPALLGGRETSSLVWPPLCLVASFALTALVAAAARTTPVTDG
jgi:membrane protease YdiL (CAAX protease family)